jgi:hypothetical protein
VSIEAVYDRSDLIHRAIDTLKRTLIEESLIVAVVCVVFLMHVRSNTEMGVVLDSRSGAGELAELFDGEVLEPAYEVRPAPQGEGLLWIERSASGEEKRYDVDPETTGASASRSAFSLACRSTGCCRCPCACTGY